MEFGVEWNEDVLYHRYPVAFCGSKLHCLTASTKAFSTPITAFVVSPLSSRGGWPGLYRVSWIPNGLRVLHPPIKTDLGLHQHPVQESPLPDSSWVIEVFPMNPHRRRHLLASSAAFEIAGYVKSGGNQILPFAKYDVGSDDFSASIFHDDMPWVKFVPKRCVIGPFCFSQSTPKRAWARQRFLAQMLRSSIRKLKHTS